MHEYTVNMQEYAWIFMKYARICMNLQECVDIFIKCADICTNMHEILINMQWKTCRNMQKYAEICRNMQVYVRPEKSALLWKYARNMQAYAEYAIKDFICSTCRNIHSPFCADDLLLQDDHFKLYHQLQGCREMAGGCGASLLRSKDTMPWPPPAPGSTLNYRQII